MIEQAKKESGWHDSLRRDCVQFARQEIESYNARRNGRCRLSISTGVACCLPGRTKSIEDLLSEADRLMYEEKIRKKNYSHKSGYP